MAQTGSTGLFRVGGLLMRGGVAQITGTGAPSNGTTGTGAGICGPGSLYIRTSNGAMYYNSNTKASPTWTLIGTVADNTITAAKLTTGSVTSTKMDDSLLHVDTVTISAANITGTSAGQLGHANGVVLVAAPGSGVVAQFLNAVVSYTFGTAAYTGGGNISINIGAGGAALSGVASFANTIGAGASNIYRFNPLSTAGVALTANAGINLVSASAPTQPGTAAGTIKVFVSYRLLTL